jgi:hypothetical protein
MAFSEVFRLFNIAHFQIQPARFSNPAVGIKHGRHHKARHEQFAGAIEIRLQRQSSKLA